MKTKTWILIFASLFVLLAALSAWTLFFRAGRVVQIEQDGKVLRTIDLERAEEETFVLAAPDGGHNTVMVQKGKICVSEADCPDQICVQRGWLTQGAPIVCLPHRLVIHIVGAQAVDGVAE